MSGLLSIRFAPDMPAAAVEVVGPDLESVGRVWLKPNGQAALEVPSEASFLRIHLPSGRIVTLDQQGSLDRSVSYADIVARLPPPPLAAQPKSADPDGPITGQIPPGWVPELKGLSHHTGFPEAEAPSFRLSGGGSSPEPTTRNKARDGKGGIRERWSPPPTIAEPYELEIELADLEARIRLPGRLARLEAHSVHLQDRRWKIVVRVRTTHPVADTVGGYLNRGDLHSAATLAASAETAEELLQEKVEDPFAAVVGAYLLLRLRRLDLLHDWTYNLAMMYPEIPDVAIIRGWHLVQAGARQREAEIRACFAKALALPLPIFTEGLQLLSEGARLLGKEFQSQLEALNTRCGFVQWSSPFTATTLGGPGGERTIRKPAELELDVDYGAPESGG